MQDLQRLLKVTKTKNLGTGSKQPIHKKLFPIKITCNNFLPT